jgi:hypothetical protein
LTYEERRDRSGERDLKAVPPGAIKEDKKQVKDLAHSRGQEKHPFQGKKTPPKPKYGEKSTTGGAFPCLRGPG